MGTVDYRNRKLRLAFALFAAVHMVLFGRPSDIYATLTSADFYLAVGISFLTTWILIEYVHFIAIKLDGRYGWRTAYLQRSLWQLLLGLLLPAVLDLLLISVYFDFLGEDIFTNGYFHIDFPVVCLMLFILNLYYVIHYLIMTDKRMVQKEIDKVLADMEGKQNESKLIQHQREVDRILRFITGYNESPPLITDILFIYRDDKRVIIVDNSGEELPGTSTLINLEELLRGSDFVRINRSIILNLTTTEEYVKGEKRNTLEFTFSEQYADIFRNKGLERFTVTKEYMSTVEMYYCTETSVL